MHNRSISIKAMITPPPAWGQPSQVGRPRQDHRYTPTHVGRTHPRDCEQTGPTVHPHSRGENALNLSQAWRISGTPPLAWGEREAVIPLERDNRYTPTRVGRTSDSESGSTRPPVHPHSRGENERRQTKRRPPSVHPHSRGENGHRPGVRLCFRRYTPTRVGRTGPTR